MRTLQFVIASLVVLLLARPTLAQQQSPPLGASAELRNASSQVVATAELREQVDQVVITLIFPNNAPLTGTHAFHIHEQARCDPPDFGSSGGIFNPFGKEHGLLNQAGPMAGDLPDLTLGTTGLVRYNVAAPLVTLRPGPASLLGQRGTSLVIDAGPDDNRTQPDGNSGAHIACGVVLGPGQAPVASSSAGVSPPVIGAGGLLLIIIGLAMRPFFAAGVPDG
jgi:Cu-Zn family superoxide dismutase